VEKNPEWTEIKFFRRSAKMPNKLSEKHFFLYFENILIISTISFSSSSSFFEQVFS